MFISQDHVNEMLAYQAFTNANIARKATEELRQELEDAKLTIAAMVMTNGGELPVGERELCAARNAVLESWKDERNRRWMFRVDSSR